MEKERKRERISAHDHDSWFRKETGHSPKSLKMFIISLFGQEETPKPVTSSVKLRRCCTCLLIPVCASPIGAVQADGRPVAGPVRINFNLL
jgi:hypothetical protein